MSALDPADDLAVSIWVAEPELATRLAALIEQTPGLRIAKPNEAGDLVLSVPNWLFMTGLQNATVNLCPNNALGPQRVATNIHLRSPRKLKQLPVL